MGVGAAVITVTLGGVVIGICILLWQVVDWWPGTKALKSHPAGYAAELLPFLIAWCYGVLGILTSMGLIGMAFDAALWASNWVGDAALVLGVGESPRQVASGTYAPLTTFGNCTMLVAAVGMVAAVKKASSGPALKRGTWCGLCLGTSSGVAGLAAVPLAQGINAIGSTVFGSIT